MTIISTPADGINLLEIDPAKLATLEEQVLNTSGRQRPVPASVYASQEPVTIAALCVKHGIYGLVTNELVEFIREFIKDRQAIEIGAGDGVLADALGIIATDNYQMEDPEIRAAYARMMQPITKYGPRVRKLDAEAAVKKYQPDVIVASWVTHKYKREEHERGGNMYAPDELWLLDNCETLIFVGNTSTHAKHRLLKQPHLHFHEEWLYSRAVKGKNFVGVWGK